MIRVMFVCHGNICRSPMAEFLFKDFVKKKGIENQFIIASSATSTEEIGNGVHRGTRAILDRLNISYAGKVATRLTASDYDKYDYFIGMDDANKYNMKRIFGGDKDGKVSLMLDYTDTPRSVADPWYTGDFTKTYNDIVNGINGFYEFLKSENLLK